MGGVKRSLTAQDMAAELRRAMHRRVWTQHDLADRAGITVGMVNRMLAQRQTVGTLPTWDAVARVLGGRWEVRLVFDDEEGDA